MTTKQEYAKMSNKISQSFLQFVSKLSQILLFNIIVSCLRFIVKIDLEIDKRNPDKDVANIFTIFTPLIIISSGPNKK